MSPRAILFASLALGLGACNDFDDDGWNRGRAEDFQNCYCDYVVEGVVTRSEAGDLDIYAVNRGRREDYHGGPASLTLDCLTGPRETSGKGVSMVLDDFKGPGTYDLAGPAFLDPSSMAFYPTNLGDTTFSPVEGSECYLDIHETRSGDFGCVDMRGPEGSQVAVRGEFRCE